MNSLLKLALIEQARTLGFDCIGVTDPDAIAQAGQYFREFIGSGRHGDMAWLAANPRRRSDPRELWNDVRSVIMLGVNYGPDQDPLAILQQRTRGAIYTEADLPRDEVDTDHCGSCQACLDICPTAAFPAPYRLDARRCISYLTIENKGPIPHEFRKAIGNRIYGCDDCLAACPWNKFAQAGREAKLAARDQLRAPSLAELARLDNAAFRALFAKSPVKRIGRVRFVRNVLIAIGNADNAELAIEARRLLEDESPLVRGAAVWALSQLMARDEFEALASEALGAETDESVRDEWRALA